MNEDRIKKGIREFKKISLTKGEKSRILSEIVGEPSASPYIERFSIWMLWTRGSRISYALVVLFAVFVSGALAYKAENALPGEGLYALKVNVTEPMRDAVNVSPESRADWEMAKTVRRLDEALQLAAKGELDEKARTDIEERFLKHTDSFDRSLQKVDNDAKEANQIEIKFENEINSRIASIDRDENTDDATSSAEQESVSVMMFSAPATGSTEDLRNAKRSAKFEKEETELDKLKQSVIEKLSERQDDKWQNHDNRTGKGRR